jgi:hypothetical protein
MSAREANFTWARRQTLRLTTLEVVVAPIADVHHARAAFDFLPAPSLPKDDQELPARGEVRPPRAVGALVATSEMWNVAEIGPVAQRAVVP